MLNFYLIYFFYCLGPQSHVQVHRGYISTPTSRFTVATSLLPRLGSPRLHLYSHVQVHRGYIYRIRAVLHNNIVQTTVLFFSENSCNRSQSVQIHFSCFPAFQDRHLRMNLSPPYVFCLLCCQCQMQDMFFISLNSCGSLRCAFDNSLVVAVSPRRVQRAVGCNRNTKLHVSCMQQLGVVDGDDLVNPADEGGNLDVHARHVLNKSIYK